MKIKRNDNSIIKKRKINLENLETYDDNKIKQAVECLNSEITNNFISHFDNIAYTFKKRNDRNHKFSNYNKNTGCISDCKRLKKKLSKIGLKTYFVSCKANGFSNPAGDSLIKEAHVFLIYPTLKNEKVYFTIFDPGFRITKIISFYDGQNSPKYSYLSKGIVKVNFVENNTEYPYELSVNKRINYKHEIAGANIHWSFNPYYETLNIDDYNEKLYHAMFSLKLMNYPHNINNYICIRAKVLEKTLEIYTINKCKIYTFKQLSNYNQQQIKNIFKEYFFEAKIPAEELNKFSKNIFLLIHNVDIYINSIIDPRVIKDYNNGYKLNR